jgi:hypothetical protein
MSKFSKILLGLLSIWPFLWIGIFIVLMMTMMFTLPHTAKHDGPPVLFLAMIVPHFLTMLTILGLQVFYIVRLLNEERLDSTQKTLWALIVFVGNMIAFPFVWYVFIWKDDPTLFLGKKPAVENK